MSLSSLLPVLLALALSTEGLSLPRATEKPLSLPKKLADEIASYQDVVEQIVDYAVNGAGRNQSYDRLAVFTDTFGSRLSGMIMLSYS